MTLRVNSVYTWKELFLLPPDPIRPHPALDSSHVVVELNLQDALFFLFFHNLNSLMIKLVIQR